MSTPNTDLVTSNPEHVTVGQPAGANWHFVNGNTPLTQQVNDPQILGYPQQAAVKS
jgi:hypothetical protein